MVAFDPDRDLALLSVPGLDRPALPLGEAEAATAVASSGTRAAGTSRIAPFEIAREVRARGQDIYDDERTEREVYVLSAALHPGDSGSALVDRTGAVVGVAFAIAPDRAGRGLRADRRRARRRPGRATVAARSTHGAVHRLSAGSNRRDRRVELSRPR